ncbi:hypothetical protein ACFX2J_004715 [Malus domestica]
MKGVTFCYLLLLVALAIGQYRTCSSGYIIGTMYIVRIVNNGDDKPVDFTCKSEDDEISRNLTSTGTQFEFGFRLDLDPYFNCNIRYDSFHADIQGIYLYMIKFDDYVKKYEWINN